MSNIFTPTSLFNFDFNKPVNKTHGVLEEISKIITNNEGEITKEQNQEIFELFFSVNEIRTEMNRFFKTGNEKLGYLFTEWIESRGLIDIIDIRHKKINWAFAVVAARIPHKHYNATNPEQAVRLAGETTGKKLVMNHPGRTIDFMYGDSRVYMGPCSTGKKFANVCFFFVYKEDFGKYS